MAINYLKFVFVQPLCYILLSLIFLFFIFFFRCVILCSLREFGPGRGGLEGGLGLQAHLEPPVEVTEVEESADLDLEREIVQVDNVDTEINHTVIIHTAIVHKAKSPSPSPSIEDDINIINEQRIVSENLRRHDSSIPAQRLGPEDDIFIEDIE